MSALLLRGARVVDPSQGIDGRRDVLVADGRIARVEESIDSSEARVVDLDGLVLAPGFIDMHVHLREPGQEAKETIATGCAAAVAGGFCAVAAMANTEPVNDCRAVTEHMLAAAARERSARVYPVGAVSVGMRGERPTDVGELVEAGVVALSDDGRPVMDATVMRRALEASARFGIPVLAHEQDVTLVRDGVVHEGEASRALDLPPWPPAGEDAMIARDLLLAEDFGGRLHVQHLTTMRGLELVRWARWRGLAVTCEVTPHHLTLTDRDLVEMEGDTDLKMNPPLRGDIDRRALVHGVWDRVVDAIATDHAPHHPQEKAADFCCAPFGTIGLETAVPVLLTRLCHEGRLPLTRLVELLSCGPARVLGVAGGTLAPGAPADLTVLDTERKGTVEPVTFESKAVNTAFKGWRTKGDAVATIVDGRIVYDAR
ncbi:MAG: dihydroorotase [Acidobacteriota bacterium]|nr:dihydroorotase [Acidobacteriota bacterium]